MAIVTHRDLKEEYIESLKKTCDEIKEQTDYVFQDMYEKDVVGIKVLIEIEPDCIVKYKIEKEYATKGDK